MTSWINLTTAGSQHTSHQINNGKTNSSNLIAMESLLGKKLPRCFLHNTSSVKVLGIITQWYKNLPKQQLVWDLNLLTQMQPYKDQIGVGNEKSTELQPMFTKVNTVAPQKQATNSQGTKLKALLLLVPKCGQTFKLKLSLHILLLSAARASCLWNCWDGCVHSRPCAPAFSMAVRSGPLRRGLPPVGVL